MKTFNTTGPCRPQRHYLIPPLERCPTALPLLQAGDYLALSGPRQSGKTSVLRALVDQINGDGWGRAVLLSCEAADQRFGVEEVDDAEVALLKDWLPDFATAHPGIRWPALDELMAIGGTGTRLKLVLMRCAEAAADKPLVVVLDEVDCLANNPFGRMLRQIRMGFQSKPEQPFPHGMVLAGMRSLRDHDVATGGDGSGSPFNIVKYVTVGNFTRDEVARLYARHTEETGQPFSDEAVAVAWEQTRGQPLMVNSLADLAVTTLVPDRSQRIEASHMEEAVRRFEGSNPAHLTSLAARLAEDRVMGVVAPVVVGDAPDVSDDDERYAVELGILERGPDERLRAASPIYARAPQAGDEPPAQGDHGLGAHLARRGRADRPRPAARELPQFLGPEPRYDEGPHQILGSGRPLRTDDLPRPCGEWRRSRRPRVRGGSRQA